MFVSINLKSIFPWKSPCVFPLCASNTSHSVPGATYTDHSSRAEEGWTEETKKQISKYGGGCWDRHGCPQAGLAEGWNSGVSAALPWSRIPPGQASPAWNREQLEGATSKGWGPLGLSASPFPACWMHSIQVQDRERALSQPANWTIDPVCLPLLCKLARLPPVALRNVFKSFILWYLLYQNLCPCGFVYFLFWRERRCVYVANWLHLTRSCRLVNLLKVNLFVLIRG